MSLQDQGFRLYVSEDRKQAKWMHPEDVPAGWVDCTDMDNKQFDSFMDAESQEAGK